MDVIDLFSGCGGLSLGFIKAGYTVKKAVEIDADIANTYRMNHPEVDVIVDDIKNLDRTGVFRAGDADVIIGGPPCQGFSMAGARIRNGFIDDPRNYLFKHYFNVVRAVRPKAFGGYAEAGAEVHGQILCTAVVSFIEVLAGR